MGLRSNFQTSLIFSVKKMKQFTNLSLFSSLYQALIGKYISIFFKVISSLKIWANKQYKQELGPPGSYTLMM